MPVQCLAIRNGSCAQNTADCSEEGSLIEFGERPAKGRGVDLISVKRHINEGETVDAIANDDNLLRVIVKHRRFFELYESKQHRVANKGNTEPIEVYIRHGPSGTGKTRAVCETARVIFIGNEDNEGFIYRMTNNSRTNFGSYSTESLILFGDVQLKKVPSATTLKRFTGRYPEEVRVLYEWVSWKPKVIFLTSRVPSSWWTPDQCDWQAIKRRVKTVVRI